MALLPEASLVFVFSCNERGNGSLRQPKVNWWQEPEPMTVKKRPIPKPKTVIRAWRRPNIGGAELVRLYEEVLCLRRAVRQAEARTKRAIVGFGPHQTN
jgi:hypothetical protein